MCAQHGARAWGYSSERQSLPPLEGQDLVNTLQNNNTKQLLPREMRVSDSKCLKLEQEAITARQSVGESSMKEKMGWQARP